jgi:hypothetical protein
VSSNPSSCVSPDARGCTLYLTQLGGFVLRQRIFFEKKKIKLFDTVNSRIYVLECMGAFVLKENKNFLKKIFLKKIFFKNKNIFKENIFISQKRNPPS